MLSSRRIVAAAASAATLALTGAAHADLPDKTSDRSGWIQASMEGPQADFCPDIAPKKISGASDPDFMTKQVLKEWDGEEVINAGLNDALFLTRALCKFPGNPDLQAALTPVWNSWTRTFGFKASDWKDFALANTPGAGRSKSERAPKDTRLADVKGAQQAAVAAELLVTDYGMDFMSYAEMLDATPTASEHLKVAFVEKCVDSYHGSIARWAICKADALSLDRKRFDRELGSETIGASNRLEAKIRFVRLQKNVEAVAAKMAKDADKDDGVSKVVEAIPAAAAKQWAAESRSHKALLDWSFKTVDDARTGSKKVMNGCEEPLRKHLAAYLEEKAPRTQEDMKNAFRDNIGSQLANAARHCFVRNKAAESYWANKSTGFSEYWGPRTMTWHGLVAEPIEFDTNRGRDPLGLPKPVILYANSSSAGSAGTIAKMKKSGDGFEISFKKETWKETVCKRWKETNRVDGIDLDSGKLIYRSRCVKTGTEKRTSQAEPVTVSKFYAAGLKKGVVAEFERNSDGTGYPSAIYASKKRKKIVGAFGVLY